MQWKVESGYMGDILPRGEIHYSQLIVNHYRHTIEKATEYKIIVNAHEAVRPTRVARTWPNLITGKSCGKGFWLILCEMGHIGVDLRWMTHESIEHFELA